MEISSRKGSFTAFPGGIQAENAYNKKSTVFKNRQPNATGIASLNLNSSAYLDVPGFSLCNKGSAVCDNIGLIIRGRHSARNLESLSWYTQRGSECKTPQTKLQIASSSSKFALDLAPLLGCTELSLKKSRNLSFIWEKHRNGLRPNVQTPIDSQLEHRTFEKSYKSRCYG